MYPEMLATGHHAIWSAPAGQRTTDLVLVLHDAGSTPQAAADQLFAHLPDGTTGLALAGHDGTWFSTPDHVNPNFPEILAAAHRVLDALDDDEFGTTSYTRIQVAGIGQGAALATTLLRVRPEAISGVVGINGYVIDNPMLTALDGPGDSTSNPAEPVRVLWIHDGPTDHPGAEFSRDWLTTHTAVTKAKTPSAITPFLTQNVS